MIKVEVTKSVGNFASISTTTLTVRAGVGLAVAKSTTVTRQIQMKIVREPFASDEDAEDDDMVIWRIDENFAKPDGIPRGLKAAILYTT